jgi:hypothetical protein
MNRLAAPAVSALFVLSACGEAPPALYEVPAEPADGPVAACDVQAAWATPVDGAGPIARTDAIVIHHLGWVDEVSVQAFDRHGLVPGEIWSGETKTAFIPTRPWAARDSVAWMASFCDEELSGRFETGSLFRGLTAEEIVDDYVDEPFSFDARVAEWVAPAATPDLETSLRFRFGAAFLVEVTAVEDASMDLLFAPALASASGTYPQDLDAATRSLRVRIDDTPYVPLPLGELTFETVGGPFVVHDAKLMLGFAPGGFDDSRLSGELDLRDWHTDDGVRGCDLMLKYTTQRCEPCAADDKATCMDLDIRGLRGLPSAIAPSVVD